VAILAVVCGLILVVGAKFRPKQVLETPISQAEMLRLQLASQRRNLEDLTAFFSRVARQATPALVWVLGLEQSGVIWDAGGGIVTAGPKKPLQLATSARGQRLVEEVMSVYYPAGELRAADNSGFRPVRRGSTEPLRQGSWILQVAANREGGYLYAPGTFEGMTGAQCGEFRVEVVETSLPLEESAAGGGVFDLEGNLLGVVLRCDTGLKAVTPDSIERILAEAKTFAGQLRRRYGLHVEPLTGEMRAYFKTDRGLLVSEVWEGWPADRAGLEPGDIVQALNDKEVATIDDLTQLLLPFAYPSFDLWVWRDGRTTRVELPARAGNLRLATGRDAGIRLSSPPAGFLIEDVVEGSRADQAMIEPGDSLLMIAGKRLRSEAAARAVLGKGALEPVYVVVQRGQRRFGAYLR